MADEKQALSKDDVDEVAGGKIDISINTTQLRKIVVNAKHQGKTIDWALKYCSTEEERKFVRMIWDSVS